MAHPSELAAWIKSLPKECVEVRVKAGPSKDRLEGIASVRKGDGAMAELIAERVEAAEVGEKFRCFAYDTNGKVLDTRYFSPGEDKDKGSDVMVSNGPVTSPEDLAWRCCVVLERMATRAMDHTERIVTGVAQPMEAMSSLFKNESERRETAETRYIEMMGEYVELQGLAGRASDALDTVIGEDKAKDPLRKAAADLLRSLFKADDEPPDAPPNGG